MELGGDEASLLTDILAVGLPMGKESAKDAHKARMQDIVDQQQGLTSSVFYAAILTEAEGLESILPDMMCLAIVIPLLCCCLKLICGNETSQRFFRTTARMMWVMHPVLVALRPPGPQVAAIVRASLLAMRMLGSSMTAATFYSFSGDAVEALGLDGEECEMPDNEMGIRFRELAVSFWSLALTSCIHAIFTAFLTKRKTHAVAGHEWTSASKHQLLHKWVVRDFVGVFIAVLYSIFCMVVCVSFLGVASKRDADRLLASVISTHIKQLIWYPLLAATLATLIATYNMKKEDVVLADAGKDPTQSQEGKGKAPAPSEDISKQANEAGPKESTLVDKKPLFGAPCCGIFG
eukprot:gnl/MRDRNA2_/MRDRNA2_85852_c0_seq1.p1 gnl/MRDRNA2_/MRDRNA2_85852_c0~~gnl/MRDRNA2_/MRDRNA2_85852_c0_seq1.p1  ORF type:complete len:369 (+),score=55.83 gnl/MRDRNA2_/MRDRNA2_85852_c0_seq1:62-1108(+)